MKIKRTSRFMRATENIIWAEPGTFFIFFPEDAHRPNINAKGYDGDKKIVVKIRTDL